MILNSSFSPVSPEESNKKHPFPCPTSYRTALTYYLDITNPPRTNVLYELAQYATDAGEQERLRKMASSAAEGKVGALPSPTRLSWGLGDPQKAPREPRGECLPAVWGGCHALFARRRCTSAGWWRPAGTSWPSCRTCPPCAPPSTTCASSCPACRPATTPSPPPPRWVCFQQGMWLRRDRFSCSSPQLGTGHGELLLVTFAVRGAELVISVHGVIPASTGSVESPTLQPAVL